MCYPLKIRLLLLSLKFTSSRFSQSWINQILRDCHGGKRKPTTKLVAQWNRQTGQKRKTQRECRKAHSSHVNDLVREDQTGNPKKLYSFIKSKKCDASGVAPLSSKGINHSDSLKKADILNQQFTSVFTKEDTSDIPTLKSAGHPSVSPIVLNRKGVLKLLNDINPFKATGPDAIPGRLLKSLSEAVVDILCLIFQASLDQRKTPKAWKKAFVSSIFKKVDRHKPSNYRPVS